MSTHPYLTYRLGQSQQEELRHQAGRRHTTLTNENQTRSPRQAIRGPRSWSRRSGSVRSVPAR